MILRSPFVIFRVFSLHIFVCHVSISNPLSVFTWKGQKPFRILSLDGGGIRGILSCIILREIERNLGQPLMSSVDLIVGTSTGGMLALLLASGYSPLQCQHIYEYACL